MPVEYIASIDHIIQEVIMIWHIMIHGIMIIIMDIIGGIIVHTGA